MKKLFESSIKFANTMLNFSSNFNRSAVMIVAGLLPLLILSPAPLADWISHLSRVDVTSQLLNGNSFWSARYYFQGLLIPNAVLDAVILFFLKLGLELDVAGTCFLMLCYFLFILGFVRLSRIGAVPARLAVALAISMFYTGNVVFGLVNFVTGLGLAMLAAAYCLNPQVHLTRRCLVTVLATPIIMFCHIMAAAVFIALYCIITICRMPYNSLNIDFRSLKLTALRQMPTMIGLLFLGFGYYLSPVSKDKFAIVWSDENGIVGFIYGKFKHGADGLSSGNMGADVMLLLIVAVWIWFLCSNRGLIKLWHVLAIALTSLLPILIPFRIGEGALLDTRMSVLPIIVAFAIMPWSTRLSTASQNFLIICCSVRTLIIASIWSTYAPVYSHLKTEFALLPRGSTLLSAYSDNPSFYLNHAPPLLNVAALAVRYGVFVPSMFAEPSQQPLVILPKWRPAWAWDHSANARNPENFASVRERARLFCALDPQTHLFILHVTETKPFHIESPCTEMVIPGH